MIKNERQYRVTRAQLERFQNAVEELRERAPSQDELRSGLEVNAVEAQAAELRAELDEYNALRRGSADIGGI